MKRVLIFLFIASLARGMEQFSTEDRKQVRMQVAKYILSKKNNTMPLDPVVATSPTLQRLKSKGVIKDFHNNVACIDDEEARTRYRVHLETNKVEETSLDKSGK
jgi:hypothetical protein